MSKCSFQNLKRDFEISLEPSNKKRKFLPNNADEEKEWSTPSKKGRFERKYLIPKHLKTKKNKSSGVLRKSLSPLKYNNKTCESVSFPEANQNDISRKFLKSKIKPGNIIRRGKGERNIGESKLLPEKRTAKEDDDSINKKMKFQNIKRNMKSEKIRKKPFLNENLLEKKKIEEINDLRQKGNNSLKNENYELAIEFYTKAFSLEPKFQRFNSILYSNAGYAYMLLENFADAIEHFEKAISLDSTNLKAKRRKILCLIKTNEFIDAENENKKLIDLYNSDEDKILLMNILEDKAKFYKNKGDKDNCNISYMKAINSYTDLLENIEKIEWMINRANIYMKLDMLDEAFTDINKAIKVDPTNIIAKKIKIKLLKLTKTSTDELLAYINELYNIDKSGETLLDLKNIYIQKGLQHLDKNEFQEAFESYGNALKYLPHDINLYEMRANIASQLNNCYLLLDDTTKAIEMGSKKIDMWILRAKCFLKEELYKEAYEDASFVYNQTHCPKIFNLMKEAENGILKSKNQTFYDILGVNVGANNKDIRKMYLKLSLKYHPDKWSHINENFRNAFAERFKKILESYKTLSDPKLKSMYDTSIRRFGKGF